MLTRKPVTKCTAIRSKLEICEHAISNLRFVGLIEPMGPSSPLILNPLAYTNPVPGGWEGFKLAAALKLSCAH